MSRTLGAATAAAGDSSDDDAGDAKSHGLHTRSWRCANCGHLMLGLENGV